MKLPAMETALDAPPPYSETILTPTTSTGDRSSISGSAHFGLVDDETAPTSLDSAEAYFESRPVRRQTSGPPRVHVIQIILGTPDDLPYPEPAQAFLARDLTHQDWLTFVNYVLPDHPTSAKNEVADGRVEEESLEERVRRLALRSCSNPRTASHSAQPHSPDDLSLVEATLRLWNEGFFLPRGIQIKLIPSHSPPSVSSGMRPGMTSPQSNFPVMRGPMRDPMRDNTPPQGGWGFRRMAPNLSGVRIGPFHADNNGFRLGRNGLVANSNGFRIGNTLVANNEGFRFGGFTASSRGVRLGGWGVGRPEASDERENPSSSRNLPDERESLHGQQKFSSEKEKGPELRDRHHRGSYPPQPHQPHHPHHHHERGRRHDHSERNKSRSPSSSSSSSSSSSDSSGSDSSAELQAEKKGFVGTRQEWKDFKKAHRHAKRLAKKERRAARRAAKRERRQAKRERKQAKREVKRGFKEAKRGITESRGGSHGYGTSHQPRESSDPHQQEGLVTGEASSYDYAQHTVPGAYSPPSSPPPNARTSTVTSREAERLRVEARELEHEALVKETVANGIRAAATSPDLPDKQRVKKLEEASVVYEEGEALRREVERLRAEASHLDREFARDAADNVLTLQHSD